VDAVSWVGMFVFTLCYCNGLRLWNKNSFAVNFPVTLFELYLIIE